MKFAFVKDHRRRWPVAVICRVLRVADVPGLDHEMAEERGDGDHRLVPIILRAQTRLPIARRGVLGDQHVVHPLDRGDFQIDLSAREWRPNGDAEVAIRCALVADAMKQSIRQQAKPDQGCGDEVLRIDGRSIQHQHDPYVREERTVVMLMSDVQGWMLFAE